MQTRREFIVQVTGTAVLLHACGGGGGDDPGPGPQGDPQSADASIPRDATPPNPDGSTPNPDASTPNPDASVPNPDASVPQPDASVPQPDAAVPQPDAAVPMSDCSTNGVNSSISGNHGHVLMIPAAHVQAGAAQTYNIEGSADHPHTVSISAAQMQRLQVDDTFSVTSSSNDGHTHTVTLRCAT